jgi:hypothetical protein
VSSMCTVKNRIKTSHSLVIKTKDQLVSKTYNFNEKKYKL